MGDLPTTLLFVGGSIVLAAVWIILLRAKLRKQSQELREYFAKEKELEKRLLQGQKLEALGQLASGIAHDFNNLLTVINGCAELLLNSLPANHPATEFATDIQKAGQRATNLTNQLLLFGRQQPVQLTKVDVNFTVTEAVRLLDRILGEVVQVQTRFEPHLPLINADAGLIHQIIVNLAVNARDAMPNGGTLSVQTELIETSARRHVRITISDTGVGMDEATQKKIFEPFFTTKDVGKGTGLGLATVYGIVQTLGGEIHFRSQPAKGTTFEIDFPAVGKTEDLDETELMHKMIDAHSVDDLTPIPSRGVVLVIEDDHMVRSLAERILHKNGYQVLAADTVTEGVRFARDSARLDLIITDVVMPQLSGPDVVRLIHQFRPGIRVIYISGYTLEELARMGIEMNATNFLQKPFTTEILMSTIHSSFSQTIPEFDLNAIT